MSEFGTVRNVARARQLILFDGIASDGTGMTDLDGLIEYHNRAIIIFEVKCRGAEVPRGQRLALERMVNNCHRAGKLTFAIVVEHEQFDPEQPVVVKDCRVREIYRGGERVWREPKREVKAREFVDVVISLANSL